MSPIVKYLFRNLSTRPFVTTLVLGYMVVVGLTMGGVIATEAGLRSAFAAKGHDNWVIVLAPNADNEKDSRLASTAINAVTVNHEITRYSPEALTINHVPGKGRLDLVMLRGLEEQGFEMHGMRLLEGRMPKPAQDEIIVGDALLEYRPDLRVGSTIRLVTRTFTVVGIFHADGHYAGEAWTTRAKFLSEPNWNALAVLLLETKGAAEASALTTRLKNGRGLELNAFTETELFDKLLSEYSHIALGLTATFILIVGGALLAAAALLAVLQQRRLPELCVLRAMGFRDVAIGRLILYETMLLVLLGGCVGLAIAAIGCRHLSFQAVAVSLSSITFHASLTWGEAAAVLGLLFLIGAFGAIVPVVRMRSTSITSGLREE